MATNPITPLDGTTTIDDKMFFEPERLSYRSAARLAAEIAGEVAAEIKGKTVIVTGTALLVDFSNLAAVTGLLAGLRKDYAGAARAARPQAVVFESVAAETMLAPALPAITAGINNALGLISLFRENVEFRGIKTAVDPIAFEMELAAQLKKGGASTVFVPDLKVVSAQGPLTGLSLALEQVHQEKADAWVEAGPMIRTLVDLESRLDIALQAGNQEDAVRLARQVEEHRRAMDPLTALLSRSDQRLSELEADLQKPDSRGLTLLGRLLRAESLRSHEAVFLHAAVVSSGGHHRISRSLFRFLLFGDGLSFMGGVVVRWGLLTSDGAVQKGGIRTLRLGDVFPSFLSKVFPTENEGWPQE